MRCVHGARGGQGGTLLHHAGGAGRWGDTHDCRGLERDGELHPIQQAFREGHGLQCGFCTPGFLLTIYELLQHSPDPDDEEIMDALGGQICRCTGYQSILASVRLAVTKMRGGQTGASKAPAPGHGVGSKHDHE